MKRQGWGKRSGKRYVALLLSALLLLGSLPVFTFAEDVGGEAAGPSPSSEGGAAPSGTEPAPTEPAPSESEPAAPDAGEPSQAEERERNTDKRGSTDDYRLTASQEEIFTEKGLAVEITAVSTFPFTRNLHIEMKDGGKPEGVKEGDGKATGDPDYAEIPPEESSSDAGSVSDGAASGGSGAEIGSEGDKH